MKIKWAMEYGNRNCVNQLKILKRDFEVTGMNYEKLINGIKRFGSTEKDICVNGIGILPEQVQKNVIVAPWWEPNHLPGLGKAEYLSESYDVPTKVWEITTEENTKITYIKTGIGAPVLMDSLLSLGVTKCRKVIFIGSVGALDEKIGIGDIVIPDYSICGDGASRYIASDDLAGNDCWGEKAYPDLGLFTKVKEITKNICEKNNVKWHIGRNFSIDTVFAQFVHIDEIMNMGCNVIEMETAAAFRAAKTANIAIAAVFSVSDNAVKNKTLISGRTEEEMNYRRLVRKNLFPEIILKAFKDD